MSKAWRSGSTPAWRRIRLAVLQRDGGCCQLKLDGCTTRATEVHHTRSRQVTGDDPAHLLASCRNCNQRVGDPTKADPAPSTRQWWRT